MSSVRRFGSASGSASIASDPVFRPIFSDTRFLQLTRGIDSDGTLNSFNVVRLDIRNSTFFSNGSASSKLNTISWSADLNRSSPLPNRRDSTAFGSARTTKSEKLRSRG